MSLKNTPDSHLCETLVANHKYEPPWFGRALCILVLTFVISLSTDCVALLTKSLESVTNCRDLATSPSLALRKSRWLEDVGVWHESICCCIYTFTSLKPTYLWCKSYLKRSALKSLSCAGETSLLLAPLGWLLIWFGVSVLSLIFNRSTVGAGTVLTVCDLFTAVIVAMGALLKSFLSVFPPFDDFFCSLSSFAPLNVLTLGLLCMACLRYSTSPPLDFLGDPDPDPDPSDRSELLWSALQRCDGICGVLKSYDYRAGSCLSPDWRDWPTQGYVKVKLRITMSGSAYDLLMTIKQSLDEPVGMGWTSVKGTASPGTIHKYSY